LDGEILTRRKAVYAMAKARHPERWRGEIRNWDPVRVVYMNPDKPLDGQSGDPLKKAA
jgi:hypothetical protein